MLASVALALALTPVRIGAVFNLSGAFASTDVPGLHGMRLAAAESGGRIQIIPIDTKSDLKSAAAIVRRAIRSHRLDAVAGLYDSDYALVVGREAQRARVPFVTSGATLPGLTDKIGDHAFMACYGDDDQAKAMAQFASEHLGVRSAYVYQQPGVIYTQTVAQDFAGALRIRRGRIAANPLGSDAAYVATTPDAAAAAVIRLRKDGFGGPILSGDGFDTPLLNLEAGPDARGVYFTTHVAYDSPEPRVRRFVGAYRARYGEAPESAAAALAYDTAGLIARAAQRGGSLRDGIAAIRNFPGVTGTISFSVGSREPQKPITVVMLTPSGPQFLARVLTSGGK